MGFDGIFGKDKKVKKKNSVYDYVMLDEGGFGYLILILKMVEFNLFFFNKFVYIFVVFIDR